MRSTVGSTIMKDCILILILVLICFSGPGCQKETSDNSGITQAAVFKVGRLPMAAVELSSNGKLLAAGDVRGVIRVWRVGTEQPFITLQGHRMLIRDLAFSFDNDQFASVGRDSTLRIWNIAGDALQTCRSSGRSFGHVSFGTKGKVLTTTTGVAPIVERWDIQVAREFQFFR